MSSSRVIRAPILALIAGIVGSYAAHRIHSHRIPRELLACSALPPDESREACFAARFRRVAEDGNLPRELGALREMAAEGWLLDCHVRAHQLGSIAHDVKGADAFHVKGGHDMCGGGYAHAVAMSYIPTAVKSGVPLDSAIARLCGSMRASTSGYVACTHGAGHGVFVTANQSLSSALSLCSTLNETIRRECIGGAAMQNSMRFLGLQGAAYDSLAPNACADVAGPEASTCHEQIGEIAVVQASYDLRRARSTCEKVPDLAGRQQCIRRVKRALPRGLISRADHWHHRIGLAINPRPPAIQAGGPHAH